jgi:hypothetical protein
MIISCVTTRIPNLVNHLVHVPINLLEGMVPLKVASEGFLFQFYGTDTRAAGAEAIAFSLPFCK